jgi:hypothetical protein
MVPHDEAHNLAHYKSTTTPKKGGLKFDPERVFNYLYFTAETRRTQSLLFLFSFDPAEKSGTFRTQENKNHKPYGNITILFEYMLLIVLLWFFRITKT